MFEFVETTENLTYSICLLIASFPQEGKIAGAYWFLVSGSGATLSGTQLIWYILLVLVHKCSFVCISSFHLLPLFKKASRAALGTTFSAAFISYENLVIIPLLQSEKSDLPVPARRWMTVVSSAGLLATRCVYTDAAIFLHPIQDVPLCVSRQENKMLLGGKGKREQTRVQGLMRGLMMTSVKDLI